jgi:hypothetical protein
LLNEAVGSADNINPAIIFSSLQPPHDTELFPSSPSVSLTGENDSSVGTEGSDSSVSGRRRNGRTHNPKKRKHLDESIMDMMKEKWERDRERDEEREAEERERLRRDEERMDRAEETTRMMITSLEGIANALIGLTSRATRD